MGKRDSTEAGGAVSGIMQVALTKKVMAGMGLEPAWLAGLIGGTFFVPCPEHVAAAGGGVKGERNFFCMQCPDAALCPLCLSAHRGHKVIQVRKSSYHDAVRLLDIQHQLDLSSIQTYVINSARIIFLRARPHAQVPTTSKAFQSSCVVCDRSLQDNFKYCSIGCKITHMAACPSYDEQHVSLAPTAKDDQHDGEVPSLCESSVSRDEECGSHSHDNNIEDDEDEGSMWQQHPRPPRHRRSTPNFARHNNYKSNTLYSKRQRPPISPLSIPNHPASPALSSDACCPVSPPNSAKSGVTYDPWSLRSPAHKRKRSTPSRAPESPDW
eukprot:jgi/Chlat1/5833/Chrsp4S06226